MADDGNRPEDLFPGGIDALVERFEETRRPFDGAADLLPPIDADLAEYWTNIVSDQTISRRFTPRYSGARKMLELQGYFTGEPEITLLHGFLISVLRRNDPPPQALPLFQRFWKEEGARLADTLTVRWLISTATTFADCGVNETQRACGMGLSVMFDMIKLHDTERRLSGKPSDTPFVRWRQSREVSIAFDMTPFSLRNGDLDQNLLARLWQLSKNDEAIRPLAVRMLGLTMTEKRSIFGRVQSLKNKRIPRPAPS